MNFATTVLKQTSSLSSSSSSTAVAAGARMSPNIAISASAHFATKIVAKSSTITASVGSQSVRFGSKRTSILMDSNSSNTSSFLNQLMPQSAQDKRLLEVLILEPDEPLYPSQQCQSPAGPSNGRPKNGFANENRLVEMHSQTACTSSNRVDDFENLPPSTNTEGFLFICIFSFCYFFLFLHIISSFEKCCLCLHCVLCAIHSWATLRFRVYRTFACLLVFVGNDQ